MTSPVPLPVLSNRLERAPTKAALVSEAQSIQHLPEHWQREQAGRIVKRKIIEFKNR